MLRWVRLLRGRFRLFLDLCPKCNSDAPAIDTCDVCCGYHTCDRGLPSREEKRLLWQRFVHRS